MGILEMGFNLAFALADEAFEFLEVGKAALSRAQSKP